MRTSFLCFIFCLFSISVFAEMQEPQDYAFVNVNVIPMDGDRVLTNQNVLIHKGRIVELGPANKVKIPDPFIKIPAKDKYLMPGLSDMHVHAHTPEDLKLFVANGVTTVRNMRGSPMHLALKDRIKKGEIIGPNFFTCGPILDSDPPAGENGKPVSEATFAATIVEQHKKAGFDCIKVYTRMSRDVYKAILKAASEKDIQVVGHVPAEVGLDTALALRQSSIEHLTGYMGAIESDHPIHREMELKTIKESDIPLVAEATARAKVWNCPTLVVQQNYAAASNYDELAALPELKYVPPVRMAMWDPKREKRFQGADFEAAKRGIEMLMKVTKELHDAGSGILLGTDAPSRFVVPGFSIHRELVNLVNSGLSPYEALRAGTIDSASFLKVGHESGTVATGKKADLILLEGNPLKKISSTQNIAGVMLHGIWLSRTDLDQILADVELAYHQSSDRFSDLPQLPEGGKELRYEILSSGIVIGEERITVKTSPDGIKEIFAQQAGDPPFQAQYSAYLQMGDEEELKLDTTRLEGKGSIQIKSRDGEFRAHAMLPYQNEKLIADNPQNKMHVDFSMAAARISVAEFCSGLKVGEQKRIPAKELDFFAAFNRGFEIQNSEWVIRREPDEQYPVHSTTIPATVYGVEMQRKSSKERMKLILDEEGYPLLIQRGSNTYRRLIP